MSSCYHYEYYMEIDRIHEYYTISKEEYDWVLDFALDRCTSEVELTDGTDFPDIRKKTINIAGTPKQQTLAREFLLSYHQ
jgi:hypothetical protein